MNASLPVALVIALAASACAKHERASAEPAGHVDLTLVGWGAAEERAVIRDVIADLERRRPGLRIAYTQVPGIGYDYLNKLRLMIAAGMAPDVFYVPDGAFAELAKSGVLLDLEDRIAASADVDRAAMWPSGVERYRWRGRSFALPKDIGPTAMFYDVGRFRERGVPLPDPVVPLTWSRAIETWRALTVDDRGTHRYGVTGFPFETAIWQSGGELLAPDKRSTTIATEPAIRAVQWCADLALRERVAPDPVRIGQGGVGGRELFEARLAATHIDGRWMVPRFRKLAFEWDVAPIPVPDGADARAVVWSGSVGLAVSAKTRHPDEAFAIVSYVQGTLVALRKAGHDVAGCDVGFSSNVPIGAGLSSSAALEISLLRALRKAFDLDVDDVTLAKIGRAAETDFVGAPIGIMDQMASSLAGDGSALFIDTCSLAYERIALPEAIEVVVVDSGVKHDHATGGYASRRAECERAAEMLDVRMLRDVTDLARIDRLPEPLRRRARHVVTENARVLEAVRCLRAADVVALGKLLNASHESLRVDFQVTVDEADRLVAFAQRDPECFGARMTGGGFGGVIVAIARRGRGAAVAERAASACGGRSKVLVP